MKLDFMVYFPLDAVVTRNASILFNKLNKKVNKTVSLHFVVFKEAFPLILTSRMRVLNLYIDKSREKAYKRNTLEEDLIIGLTKGETGALNKLYNMYSGLFFTIASRYTKDTQEAEDHVQDAFVQIYRKINTFRFQGSFEGWMKRIVVNICLSALRKNKILVNDSIDEIDDFYEFSENNWSIESMTADEIIESINELPLGCKTVLNLNVMEGFSHKEIGKQLGISESASRSQLTKARAKLKVILSEKKLIEQ